MSTTRLENVDTPLLEPTVVVPELKVDCGLPAAMLIVVDPLAEVTTFPNASSICTPTLGIGLPAVPGPGEGVLKTSCVGWLGATVKGVLVAVRAP